jgi:hypothetical protein
MRRPDEDVYGQTADQILRSDMALTTSSATLGPKQVARGPSFV